MELFSHPRIPVTFAVFSGTLPTRTQWDEIRTSDLGVAFRGLPAEYTDIGNLVRDAPFIKHLSVLDGRCEDANPLRDLDHLETLEFTNNQKSDVDLTQFSALTLFWGEHPRFESVAACEGLKSIALQNARGDSLNEIAGPVEYLELIGAGSLRVMPRMRRPGSLKSAWILGAKELDLAGTASLVSLDQLSLQSCARVVNVDALGRLPSLRVLGLISCAQIEPKESLLRLRGTQVAVSGRNPFDAEFRAAAKQSNAEWIYN